MDFKDKIVLITGSTSGIGKATAQKLIKEGATVILNSYEELNIDIVKSEFGENTFYIKGDVSNKTDVENIKNVIEKQFGKLDYLVSNAGIMPTPCGIDDITEEIMDKTINVNLKGTFWVLKIIGNLINKTSTSGSIVTVSSVDGIIGEPYGAIYSTTKAGIISLTKSFARYFKNPLVRVNCVAPGLIDTPLTATTGEDPAATTDLSIIQRMGKPEEIANTIAYLLSDDASFITGQIIAVDGGFTLK